MATRICEPERLGSQALSAVEAGLSVRSGPAFFESLSRVIETSAHTEGVIIAEFCEDAHCAMRSRIISVDGTVRSNFNMGFRRADVSIGVQTGSDVDFDPGRVFTDSPDRTLLLNRHWRGAWLADSTESPLGCLLIAFESSNRQSAEQAILLRFFAERAAAELERKRQEKARRASDQRYRTLFEAAGDAIFLMRQTEEGPIFLECNTQALELFDRRRDEVIGISPADPAISPRTQADGRTSRQFANDVARAALAGSPQRFEWDHLKPNGDLIHTEVSLNRLELDDAVYIQAITRDITARIDAERGRRTSEGRYRSLFEAAGDAIFLMQLPEEGPVFLDCNSRACEMFERSRDEIIGSSPADPRLSTPTQPDGRTSEEMAASVVREALAGAPQRFEWDHRRADGSVFHSEVTLNRLDLNDTIYVQAITRDVTERKKAEILERLLMSELDHRVRNNLSTILSLITLTNETSDSQAELVEKLAGRVHAVAIAQEGLAAQNWSGVEIGQVVQRVMQRFYGAAQERVQIEGPEALLPAGVSGPFSMCLNELATKAVKHGVLAQESGTIRLTWSRRDDDRLCVRWVETGGRRAASELEVQEGRGLGLIRGFVEHQLRGEFQLVADSESFEVSMTFPLEEQTYQTELGRKSMP